ncbi:MAG: hypothetical protein AAB890_02465, partial [Patescibacteria group bacterium]
IIISQISQLFARYISAALLFATLPNCLRVLLALPVFLTAPESVPSSAGRLLRLTLKFFASQKSKHFRVPAVAARNTGRAR